MLIQYILIFIIVLAFITTWRRVVQNVIRVSEAIGWSIVWIGAGIVILQPDVSTRLANLLGVGRGSDLVVYASVVALFLLVFKLFLKHESLERKLTDIVRHDALRDLDNPHE